jgi:hypothetical protein
MSLSLHRDFYFSVSKCGGGFGADVFDVDANNYTPISADENLFLRE